MLRIYNSLTRKIDDFHSLQPGKVSMYTCGPTVYDFAHIGNFRTYVTSDLLLRTLQYNGYEVSYVMNITDVGHLTGDNLGDADTGEDRMEKSALSQGKTAWEIAEFYTDAFLKDFRALNLTEPLKFTKATDHIQEQIDLIKKLDDKGYTYRTSDGIYFDTARFKNYGKLSNLDQIKEGARVEANPEKLNPRDFALWKFSPEEGSGLPKRQMEWDSSWGKGFPGWHIECSAMSMKYLGESFDVHAGGIDLRETHHPNEIAQAEAVTGKQFVAYWVHGAFVLVQGERMSKSKGNNYKLYDLIKQGYDPLILRYLYLQTHYRQEMNFTFPALESAKVALNKLREFVIHYDIDESVDISEGKEALDAFQQAINDDLNTSKALAILWAVHNSELSNTVKAKVILQFDNVLGLDLKNAQMPITEIDPKNLPGYVKQMIEQRRRLRIERLYKEADAVRDKLRRLGYEVDDTEKGIKVKKVRL